MEIHHVTGGGGLQLHVEESGNPGGQPILFIHGFSLCRLAWRRQVASDLEDDFRLVTLDIRGHGLSDKPHDAYGDSRLWADDIDAVIDSLELDQPVLCGWSYGGVIICDYIRHCGQRRIGAINLVGAVTKLGTDAALALILPAFLELAPGFFSDDAVESATALAAFTRRCVHGEPSAEDFHLGLGCATVVPPYVRQGLLSRRVENDDLLPRITCPVLVTHGERDTLVSTAAADEHTEAITNASLSLYPAVGHAPFLEAPDRFNQELRSLAEQAEHAGRARAPSMRR